MSKWISFSESAWTVSICMWVWSVRNECLDHHNHHHHPLRLHLQIRVELRAVSPALPGFLLGRVHLFGKQGLDLGMVLKVRGLACVLLSLRLIMNLHRWTPRLNRHRKSEVRSWKVRWLLEVNGLRPKVAFKVVCKISVEMYEYLTNLWKAYYSLKPNLFLFFSSMIPPRVGLCSRTCNSKLISSIPPQYFSHFSNQIFASQLKHSM